MGRLRPREVAGGKAQEHIRPGAHTGPGTEPGFPACGPGCLKRVTDEVRTGKVV